MKKLERSDLYSLEKYSELRKQFRENVMQYKLNRRLQIGPNAALYFENRLTIHYQIQEMLRIEKIFEAKEIQEELDTYNPLIPDGTNLKATFMLEYDDPVERREQLTRLLNIESKVWLKVNGFERILPVADEDLERATEDKTSSVHFLRFELDDEMINEFGSVNSLAAGIDHDAYRYTVDPVPESIRLALLDDFD